MTLLKLTSPGVPDVYQGDELELLQLVDPDNRGPVDWERRRALLDEVLAGAPLREETAQLHVLTRVLRLRAALPEAFAGPYEPLAADEGVCAFERSAVRVAVPIRPDAAKGEAPDGWRDLLPELHVGLFVRSDAYPTGA